MLTLLQVVGLSSHSQEHAKNIVTKDTAKQFLHESTDQTIYEKGLAFLGVSKVPLATLIYISCLVWGITGFTATYLLQSILSPTTTFLLASFAAVSVTIIFSSLLGRVFSSIIPPEGKGARSEISLLGELATVQSLITKESGTVLIKSGKDMFRVSCRTKTAEETIEVGSTVQLTSYEPNSNVFFCEAVKIDSTPRPRIELTERK